jgi:hypothetical protein
MTCQKTLWAHGIEISSSRYSYMYCPDCISMESLKKCKPSQIKLEIGIDSSVLEEILQDMVNVMVKYFFDETHFPKE